MSQPFIGEIRIFAGNFPPQGWAFCDGALQSIANNTTLFTLIGSTYGGDGVNTFGLPDLRGRVPLHVGGGLVLAQQGGLEAVTLTTNQIPSHNHVPLAQSGLGTSASPLNGVWARSGLGQYSSAAPSVVMNGNALGNSGGSQPHANLMPFTGLNFIISLFGIFPSP